MSLKSRISQLEEESSSETDVLVFETHYKGKEGSVEATIRLAIIDFGRGQTITTSQFENETRNAFEDRLKLLKGMSVQNAHADWEVGK